MSYLQKLGMGEANYDLKPYVPVKGYETQCWTDWSSIGAELKRSIEALGKNKAVVAIECYSGIIDEEVVPALQGVLNADVWIGTEAEVLKTADEIDDGWWWCGCRQTATKLAQASCRRSHFWGN